jgi:hypothetical protein
LSKVEERPVILETDALSDTLQNDLPELEHVAEAQFPSFID